MRTAPARSGSPHEHVETASGGVGGAMREYVIRGSDLVLGIEQIQHPVTALADVSKGKLAQSDLSGIVGIGALKRYVVTFDFPGKRLFLKRYEPAPADLDTYEIRTQVVVSSIKFHVSCFGALLFALAFPRESRLGKIVSWLLAGYGFFGVLVLTSPPSLLLPLALLRTAFFVMSFLLSGIMLSDWAPPSQTSRYGTHNFCSRAPLKRRSRSIGLSQRGIMKLPSVDPV